MSRRTLGLIHFLFLLLWRRYSSGATGLQHDGEGTRVERSNGKQEETGSEKIRGNVHRRPGGGAPGTPLEGVSFP